MIAALLPLKWRTLGSNKSNKPIPYDDIKKYNCGMFSIDELFNPLSSLGSDTDDEDSSSSLCVNCHDCEAELNRLLVNTYQEDEEWIIRCKQCAAAAATATATTEKRCRRVRFATTTTNNNTVGEVNGEGSTLMVVVHLIPSHRDYTDEEYYGMWHHPDELLDNASRNRIEYKYEGHWKMAYEEDQFIMCSDGKLYHPVTVRLHLRQLHRQQRQQQQQKQQQQQQLQQQLQQQQQHMIETHQEQQEQEQENQRWGVKNNNNQRDVPMKKPLKKIEEVEQDEEEDDDTVSSTSVSSTCSSTSSTSSDNQITPQEDEEAKRTTTGTNMVVVPTTSTTTDLVVADAPLSPRLIACVG